MPIYTRDLAADFTYAGELQEFFRERGLVPAETLLIIAALHSSYLIQAQREGKPATAEKFAELYCEALKMYEPIVVNHVRKQEAADAPSN